METHLLTLGQMAFKKKDILNACNAHIHTYVRTYTIKIQSAAKQMPNPSTAIIVPDNNDVPDSNDNSDVTADLIDIDYVALTARIRAWTAVVLLGAQLTN